MQSFWSQSGSTSLEDQYHSQVVVQNQMFEMVQVCVDLLVVLSALKCEAPNYHSVCGRVNFVVRQLCFWKFSHRYNSFNLWDREVFKPLLCCFHLMSRFCSLWNIEQWDSSHTGVQLDSLQSTRRRNDIPVRSCQMILVGVVYSWHKETKDTMPL